MHNLSLGTECPMLGTNVPSWGRTNERTNELTNERKKLSIERSASVKKSSVSCDNKVWSHEDIVQKFGDLLGTFYLRIIALV